MNSTEKNIIPDTSKVPIDLNQRARNSLIVFVLIIIGSILGLILTLCGFYTFANNSQIIK